MWRIAGALIIAAFCAVYLGKALAQRKRGIRTYRIAQDRSDPQRFRVESIMQIATVGALIAGVISIALDTGMFSTGVRIAGLLVGLAGVGIFAASASTMRDNWRAGIAPDDKTEMVTSGIYRCSRNPAFLGFDLMYLGILLAFFNWPLLVLTLLAVVMLHLQILQEERYLSTTFGKCYSEYRSSTRRYLGRKQR